jgi:hypothetical protein
MYDFFIAHAGNDKDKAEALHGIFNKSLDVFLDKNCRPGRLLRV